MSGEVSDGYPRVLSPKTCASCRDDEQLIQKPGECICCITGKPCIEIVFYATQSGAHPRDCQAFF